MPERSAADAWVPVVDTQDFAVALCRSTEQRQSARLLLGCCLSAGKARSFAGKPLRFF